MTVVPLESNPRGITAWVCDECNYWRQDKSTGIHTTQNHKDPNGPLARHTLREARFGVAPRYIPRTTPSGKETQWPVADGHCFYSCGKEVEEGKGGVLRTTFNDTRKMGKQARCL